MQVCCKSDHGLFLTSLLYPMKKKLLLFVALSLSTLVSGQSVFGIKAGLFTPYGAFGGFTVNHADTSFDVALKDAKYGFHVGTWFRFGDKLFIQPEVQFSSNRTTYELNGGIFQTPVIKSEKYLFIEIPVIFGARLGPVSLQAGPVGHYLVKSTSEFTDLDNYEQKFRAFTYSYQLGAGLDIGRIGLDVRYQGKFSNNDGHMVFFGERYNFDKNPAHIMASLRLRLID